MSDILRSPNGFHIVKLLDKRGKDKAPVDHADARAPHPPAHARRASNEADVRERLARVRERIAAGEDFGGAREAELRGRHGRQGGDLGWISPGDTVPEFERVMNSLKDGELSQPVQTPFGWHLVQVLERRTEEMSEDRRKLAARQTVRARKADEAYQDWLRQTRDRAFVENRLEER